MFNSFSLPSAGHSEVVSGVPASIEPFILTTILSEHYSHIHIVNDDQRLRRLHRQLQNIAPHIKIIIFPEWDCLPYDRVSPSQTIMGERLAALTALMDIKNAKVSTLILTTVAAFSQRVIAPCHLPSSFTFTQGQTLDITALTQSMTQRGYHRVDTVREPAEYAIRGGIIDVFPAGEVNPYRFDLFGDHIESIRFFDPLSQRSLEPIAKIEMTSASEVLLTNDTIKQFRESFRQSFSQAQTTTMYQSVSESRIHNGMEHWLPLFYTDTAHILDYLSDHVTLSFADNSHHAMESRWQQIQEYYDARLHFISHNTKLDDNAYLPLPPQALYLDPHQCFERCRHYSIIYFTSFSNPSAIYDYHAKTIPNFNDLYKQHASKNQDVNVIKALIDYLRQQLLNQRPTIITCHTSGSMERLQGWLHEHQFNHFKTAVSWAEAVTCAPHTISLMVLEMAEGFSTTNLTIITEQDIFGERFHNVRKKRRRADLFVAEASSLSPGDFIVHIEHGIGQYQGLHTLTVGNVPHDCVCLTYEGGDKLFVPVENLELLSRYGGEDSQATVDKLGSANWQNRKARVKKKIFAIAEHLLKIAAERQIQTGDVFDKPDVLYEEFVARFPYNETDDQWRAIDDVITDLAAGHPMDRLICGDVGFGKTEIALRAAFIVAMQGKQVALISPTTLLCAQHYKNFGKRFADFGLSIAQLSRLVSATTLKKTKNSIADGHVDIVIGTHGIMSESTRFKDLGLVIIDEEQHFGVKQKERLKELQPNVHLLTLSATPIPRTLQMALTNVKDMSIMATPPLDRLAVRTFVLPYDPVVIREAIVREHFRGGQIFYVCPRIEDLANVKAEIDILIPEIKSVIIHGQMPASAIETIMLDFSEKKFELLLSTNIIESGLDLPAVNTIIIHRADMFGLAQLYQLRGRVGRTKIRGYAYLTIPNHVPISPIAHKRLEVMQTLDTLGAGFQLASHDMDIRGTGNMLGAEQSGHIREVGVELYQQMLEDAVNSLKSRQFRDKGETELLDDEWTPQININLPILLPETYVADLGVRLSLYRRLSHLKTVDDLHNLREEIIDRFGPLPQEAAYLLAIMHLKQSCRIANIEKIDLGSKGTVISFRKNIFMNSRGLIEYVQKQKGTAFIRPDQKLVFLRSWPTVDDQYKGIKLILKDIVMIAETSDSYKQ